MAKVLIVEDDKFSQLLLVKVLGNAGHETMVAESPQQAWDKLQEHVLVDMVVLDNQLGNEWGWQFLGTLRKNPVYSGLPVIVYTAHAERSSIVHYVHLGVQSLQVKPYKADVLLAELAKAVDSKWALQVMVSPETLCASLNLTMDDYGPLLAKANRSIKKSLLVARRLVSSPNDPQLFQALTSIDQQCRTVGIPVAEGVIAQVRASVHGQDIMTALEGLQSIESFMDMIRHRLLAVTKMSGPVESAADVRTATVATPADEAALAGRQSREIASAAVWQFGPHLKRVLQHPLLSKEELQARTRRVLDEPPLAAITDAVKLLERIPTMDLSEAVTTAWETPGFATNYQALLTHVTGSPHEVNSSEALRRAADQQGVANLVVLVAAAQVANALPEAGLLNLRLVSVQNLTVALLAFEIGRLLNMADEWKLAEAGFVHDAGRWLFAVGEPGPYALALALADDGSITLEESERALFGMDHHEAGRQLLKYAGLSKLMQAAAGMHRCPEQAADEGSSVAVIHLSYLLAQVSNAPTGADALSVIERLRDPDYPAWAVLDSHGVVLPMETPALVDALLAAAVTSHWTACRFVDGSTSGRGVP